MKIYVFPEGNPEDANNFVAPIRLLDPLRRLATKYEVAYLCHRQGLEANLFAADIVIVQRACFTSRSALDSGFNLLSRTHDAGIPIVYEIDDHLFCPSLPDLIADSAVDELDEEAFDLTQAHKEILNLADYTICPTEPLAEAIRELGGSTKVIVLPTALDFDLPRWRLSPHAQLKAKKERVYIGWSGGSRVGRDLEIIRRALREIVNSYANVVVIIAGALKYARLFSDIPKKQLCLLEWVPYDGYPALLSMFDLALIPMQDHAYNRCKSPLKVIDYAAMGVPAICSPVAPFLNLRGFEWSPFFAEDTDEWITLIEDAFRSRIAYNAPSEQLARATRQQYGLPFHLHRFWSVLEEIVNSHSRR